MAVSMGTATTVPFSSSARRRSASCDQVSSNAWPVDMLASKLSARVTLSSGVSCSAWLSSSATDEVMMAPCWFDAGIMRGGGFCTTRFETGRSADQKLTRELNAQRPIRCGAPTTKPSKREAVDKWTARAGARTGPLAVDNVAPVAHRAIICPLAHSLQPRPLLDTENRFNCGQTEDARLHLPLPETNEIEVLISVMSSWASTLVISAVYSPRVRETQPIPRDFLLATCPTTHSDVNCWSITTVRSLAFRTTTRTGMGRPYSGFPRSAAGSFSHSVR